jgi:hypothetical protein
LEAPLKVRQLGWLVLLLGCSGADGDGAPPDFFNVDQEVVDTDRAPNDTDAPPNDSESGSDTDRAVNATDTGETGTFTPEQPNPNPGGGPGGSNPQCNAFCQRLGDAGCSVNACASSCPTDPCRAPLIRLGDCVIALDRCPDTVDAGDPALNSCSDELDDYVSCQEDPPPPMMMPDPMLPPGCSPDTGCDCGNECDACLCAVDPSAADVCDQYCQ